MIGVVLFDCDAVYLLDDFVTDAYVAEDDLFTWLVIALLLPLTPLTGDVTIELSG